jgi:hypothetical protein
MDIFDDCLQQNGPLKCGTGLLQKDKNMAQVVVLWITVITSNLASET